MKRRGSPASVSHIERRWRFDYDAGQRLVGVQETTNAGSSSVELLYGDGGTVLGELRPEGMTARVYGPTGRLAIMAPNGSRLFPVRDYLGSPCGMIDTDGRLHQRAVYDPFGVAGSASDPSPAPVMARGFGDYLDLRGTGLLHAGGRLYSPLLGRFTSPDPARQLDSPYAFAGGDPLHHVDPDGRISLDVARVGVGLLSVLLYGGLGVALGAAIGGIVDSTRRSKSNGLTATQLGAIIGVSAGVGLGILRTLAEAVIIPIYRDLRASSRNSYAIILLQSQAGMDACGRTNGRGSGGHSEKRVGDAHRGLSSASSSAIFTPTPN